MISVRTEDLCFSYGPRLFLEKISLEIQPGEAFALFGPVGSGKTTLLRLLNLLNEPSAGEIYLNGQKVTNAPGWKLRMRRTMALMFQKPVMFNTSVYENVAYPLKVRGCGRQAAADKVKEVLRKVGLEDCSGRNARVLSGGETQRLALARALVTEPQLLLLDEPTANCDLSSVAMIEELVRKLHRQQKTTILIATHELDLARRLADRAGVLMDGRLRQTGRIQEIFDRPNSRRLAEFIGLENIVRAKVTASESGMVSLEAAGRPVEAVGGLQAGQEVYLCIRPEDVVLSPVRTQSSARNVFPSVIGCLHPAGPLVKVEFKEPFPKYALVTGRSASELNLKVGQNVYVSFKATAVHVMEE